MQSVNCLIRHVSLFASDMAVLNAATKQWHLNAHLRFETLPASALCVLCIKSSGINRQDTCFEAEVKAPVELKAVITSIKALFLWFFVLYSGCSHKANPIDMQRFKETWRIQGQGEFVYHSSRLPRAVTGLLGGADVMQQQHFSLHG